MFSFPKYLHDNYSYILNSKTFKNSLHDLKHCVLAPLRSQMMQNTPLFKKRVRRLIEGLAGNSHILGVVLRKQ